MKRHTLPSLPLSLALLVWFAGSAGCARIRELNAGPPRSEPAFAAVNDHLRDEVVTIEMQDGKVYTC